MQPVSNTMGNNESEGHFSHLSTPAIVSLSLPGLLRGSPLISCSHCFLWFCTSILALASQPHCRPTTLPPTTTSVGNLLSVHILSKAWPLISLLFPLLEMSFHHLPPLPELQLLYTCSTVNWLNTFFLTLFSSRGWLLLFNLPFCSPSPLLFTVSLAQTVVCTIYFLFLLFNLPRHPLTIPPTVFGLSEE